MGLLFRGEDLDPLAVGIGDEVQAHAGVLSDDAAHLLVEFMEGVEVVHGEGDMGVLAAVVVGLHLPAVPGELDLEGRLVVCGRECKDSRRSQSGNPCQLQRVSKLPARYRSRYVRPS